MEFGSLRLTRPHLDRDARRSEARDPLSLNAWERVLDRDHTAFDASLDNGVHAGRRSAVMATWLQGHIERCPPCPATRLPERNDLGMGAADLLRPATSCDSIGVDNDGPHRWVW